MWLPCLPLQVSYPLFTGGYPLAFCIAVCQYVYMICISCFHPRTKVTNSRPHKKAAGGTWRRRQCVKCNFIFSTLEKPTDSKLRVSTQADSGHAAVPFSLSRLTLSIGRCFGHNVNRGKDSALELAMTVEQALIRSDSEPSKEDVTILTHQTLGHFDSLAAIQYAAQHDLLLSTKRARRTK